MINYSLSMRPNPMNKEAAKKAYAVAQAKETLDLDAFAEHITSHGCVYSKGDIPATYELTTHLFANSTLQLIPNTIKSIGDNYIMIKNDYVIMNLTFQLVFLFQPVSSTSLES